MSQTFSHSVNQTTTNRHSGDYPGIKISNDRVNPPLQLPAIFFLRLVAPQRFFHRPSRKVAFKAKVLALVIAACTLPVWASRTHAYHLSDRALPQLIAQAEQARIDDTKDVLSDSSNSPSLTLLIETVVASLLLVGLLTAFFANRAMRPIKSSAEPDEKPKLEPDDLSFQLAPRNISTFLDQPDITEQQVDAAEQAKLLTEISLRIRQAQHLDDLLKTTVKELRRAVRADRAFIYRFNPDWSGCVVAESVLPGWPSCLKIKVTDTYFAQSSVGAQEYKNGRVVITDDIFAADLNDCHLRLLEQFAIKAQMVAPILKNNELFALLIVNQCSEPRQWQEYEVDLLVQLAKQVGFAIEQVSFQEQQEAEAERAELMTEISLRIQQARFLEDVLKITVKEVRRALKTDRVLLYGLDSNHWDGIVVAESVAPGLPQTLRVRIDDPCLQDGYAEKYQNGLVTAINDIYQDSRVNDCYRSRLEQFAVRANLVAPVLKNNQLLGLMIAHHCSEPRQWQPDEIDLFAQLAIQVGFAVDRVSLLEEMTEQIEPEEI
jgi:twitching motility protein PilJ